MNFWSIHLLALQQQFVMWNTKELMEGKYLCNNSVFEYLLILSTFSPVLSIICVAALWEATLPRGMLFPRTHWVGAGSRARTAFRRWLKWGLRNGEAGKISFMKMVIVRRNKKILFFVRNYSDELLRAWDKRRLCLGNWQRSLICCHQLLLSLRFFTMSFLWQNSWYLCVQRGLKHWGLRWSCNVLDC